MFASCVNLQGDHHVFSKDKANHDWGGGILAGVLAVGLWGGPIALSQNASGPQLRPRKLHFEGTTAISAAAPARTPTRVRSSLGQVWT